MAYVNAQQSRVLIGDFAYSPKLTKAAVPWSQAMLDISTLADTSKQFLAGLDHGKIDMAGFLDEVTFTDATQPAWAGAQALTWAPRGTALGSELQMVSALKATLTPGSKVSGVVSFDLKGETDGATDVGVSLHDLAAETLSTNGTGYDGTAASTNGGVGHLHVTAFSGFTNIIVKVQHSTDNITFADLITFSTATGVTGERAAVTGTVNRYVRALWTKTGTGSATFQVGFARR